MLETQERFRVLVPARKSSAGGFLSACGRSDFVLSRPPNDWMNLTHIMEGSLLYSKSTNLSINLIKKKITETSKIMFDRTRGHHGVAALTCKINYDHICGGGKAGDKLRLTVTYHCIFLCSQHRTVYSPLHIVGTQLMVHADFHSP